MPRFVRPHPPLPVSVTIATRAFGSEANVAIIRYFMATPSTMSKAADALDLPRQIVNRDVKELAESGVLVELERRPGTAGITYGVDNARLLQLLSALQGYVTGLV